MGLLAVASMYGEYEFPDFSVNKSTPYPQNCQNWNMAKNPETPILMNILPEELLRRVFVHTAKFQTGRRKLLFITILRAA